MSQILGWSVHFHAGIWGSTHPCGNIHNVGKIMFSWKTYILNIWKNRKREKLGGKTRGLMGRCELGMGLIAHQGPVPCMRALMGFVVGVRVVFGVVVGPVLVACVPEITKLILGCAATKPQKYHIHHLGPVRDNIYVGNSCCCRVIHLDRFFWFGPTHGHEGLAVGNHFSCSDD
jgi:hypothetical protein